MALEKQLCSSWATHNLDELGSILDPDFTVVDENGGMARQQVIEQILHTPLNSCFSVDTDVKVYGNAAWAFSVVLFEAYSFAEQRSLADTWIRQSDGQWKLVFRHSTKQDPMQYLDYALGLMAEHSLRSPELNWKQIREEAHRRARGAEVPADTYAAIRSALFSLGDRHSHLQLSPELEKLEAHRSELRKTDPVESQAQAPQRPPSSFAVRTKTVGRMIRVQGRSYALVVIPSFSPNNDAEGTAFETGLQRTIAELDAQHPAGWIVDLRGNLGGNLWPMLTGIGPLLGDQKEVSQSITRNGMTSTSYYDGLAGFDGVVNGEPVGYRYPRIGGVPYVLSRPAKIAILVDHSTASSGEMVAIAFRGQKNTRFFGEHTLGVTTVTNGWTLIDGANPVVAVGVTADRNGVRYPDGIEPDEVVASGSSEFSLEQDPVVLAAAHWLGRP